MSQLHLAYHYVRPEPAPGPVCTPERLRLQIKTLKSKGYEFLTCGEVAERMGEGKPLPEKTATLSFDDGLKDQYTIAWPILQECEVRGTLFVPTCVIYGEVPPVIGFQVLIKRLGAERLEREILPKVLPYPYATLLDPARYDIRTDKWGEAEELRRIKWVFNHFLPQSLKRELLADMFTEHVGAGVYEGLAKAWFLNSRELREMDGAGMETASHTVSHPPLDITGLSEIGQELADSKKHLGRLLEKDAKTFGYTYGEQKFRPVLRELVMSYFKSAWNFWSQAAMPARGPWPYALDDMPRLHEAFVNVEALP